MKFKELYFHTAVIAVGASLLSSVAFAENVRGVTQDHYKTVIKQRPYSVEVCKEVTVSGDRTGDTLKGAILGGIIGHQIDHDKGSEIGAILGGAIGHNNSTATGSTRTQCQTETRYEEEQLEVYNYSTITFWSNGQKHTVKYTRK